MNDLFAVQKVLRAFESKDVGFIRTVIIHQRINPNLIIPCKGVSLLHLIIGHQSENFAFKITKMFLQCGGDPNLPSSDGVTPTHVAAGWGRNRILHLLLVNGGDPWIQDDEKRNAFNYAFEEQEWSTIDLLHHFQQMHSAANSQADTIQQSIKVELEKALFQRGEHVYSYSPIKYSNKSIMTEGSWSPSDTTYNPLSPIRDKIKYFEPKAVNSEGSSQKSIDKLDVGWSKTKDVRERREIIICDDSGRTVPENTTMRGYDTKRTFVSSIHLGTFGFKTSIPSDTGYTRVADDAPLNDVRGKLFVELREAVRRRSKQVVNSDPPYPDADSVVVLENSLTSSEDTGREATGLQYGSNYAGLNRNTLLRNVSDLASRVLEEDGDDGEKNKTVNLCTSSGEISDCPGNSPEEGSLQKIRTFVIPQCSSDSSTVYLTPYNSTANSDMAHEASKGGDSSASFVSLSEEHKYTDTEEGVAFLEKKLVVTPTVSLVFDAEEHKEGDEIVDESDTGSESSSAPSTLSCDSDVLRSELLALGCDVGPVTVTTKKLYLKKLWRIQKQSAKPSNHCSRQVPVQDGSSGAEWYNDATKELKKIGGYRSLEEFMHRSFEVWTKRHWREGTNKTSFNYLLLDPRISLDLPRRVADLTESEAWNSFLSSIFYVGKGKRNRPYAHLYEAAVFWRERRQPNDEKVARIIDIWGTGQGVVCLQVFQNLMPVEALTREAAMIEALGLSCLMNVKAGEYYGVASTWSLRDKKKLGFYLLHKAYLIFLNEGERQIKPYDI